ncbi:hypothetical protein HCZ30_01295 [Marivivens donghaensis]|uniref:Regulatory protein SoxS n=2 Tax=Marivivens donghaensis TaxID=1699413 RepID=A0ABX0VTA6_9RHOB|nr:hypothetical protein [Marivivens donghaensis]
MTSRTPVKRIRRPKLKYLIAALSILVAAPVAAETQLLMVRETGCFWCARWDAEVGDAYDKTTEGKAAPLVTADLHGSLDAYDFVRPVVFSPTFVLIEDNVELGRIEGYPGEDFFWGFLGNLLAEAELPAPNI